MSTVSAVYTCSRSNLVRALKKILQKPTNYFLTGRNFVKTQLVFHAKFAINATSSNLFIGQCSTSPFATFGHSSSPAAKFDSSRIGVAERIVAKNIAG